MLPPFVPPAARVVTETLPLITEFLVDRKEQSFSFDDALPLITAFVVDRGAGQRTESAAPVEDPWMEEERNSFDWHSVSRLATKPNEERLASDDWETTNWDAPTAASSATDHVAAMLFQVARRIRAGELKIDATRGMSAEAALAATLAALLQNEQ